MELLKSLCFQILIFLVCLFSFTCCNVHRSIDHQFVFKMTAAGEIPNLAIVTQLKNNSESDYCLLGLEGYNDVFIKTVTNNDSIWQDFTNIFYLQNLPSPKFPPNQVDENDFFSLPLNYRNHSDLFEFYNHLKNVIKTHYDINDAEYWQLISFSIFKNAIFLKAGEEWKDTLNISTYYSNHPNHALKFSRKIQEKITLYADNVISIDSLFHKWKDELGVIAPDNFNGYKLIYKDINLKSEIIIDPNDE